MEGLNETAARGQGAGGTSVGLGELVGLCAVDDGLYAKTFFPKTVRQATPAFHRRVDAALNSQERFISLMIFRGGAKTSKLRLFVSKQIAYGISHTILFVSNAQGHSIKSLEWLKKNVEFNSKWAQTFGLTKGVRWAGEDIEILHGVDKYPIRVIALGITGQVRGVNIDDFRPDLIIVDDPDDEETTATAEQRKKTSDLFFGALAKSLAPRSEAPNAKMVLLQTPFNDHDLISACGKDEQWTSLHFGCFDVNGESSWPERFPTEELLADKQAHVRRGQLALWMREMECAIVPEGGASFNPENLKYWDVLPDKLVYIITIDPASSDAKGADDQVIMVLGFSGSDVYLVEYTAEKGEMPEAAVTTLMEYIRRYQPLCIVVESIAYQRVLAWFIEQEMKRQRKFVPVNRIQDRRRKADRILQALGSATGYGRLRVKTNHFAFLDQYANYSPLSKAHDDILDACAMGIDYSLTLGVADWLEAEYEDVSESKPKQLEFRQCP